MPRTSYIPPPQMPSRRQMATQSLFDSEPAAPQRDEGAQMMQMLGQLYGMQQDQEMTPGKMQGQVLQNQHLQNQNAIDQMQLSQSPQEFQGRLQHLDLLNKLSEMQLQQGPLEFNQKMAHGAQEDALFPGVLAHQGLQNKQIENEVTEGPKNAASSRGLQDAQTKHLLEGLPTGFENIHPDIQDFLMRRTFPDYAVQQGEKDKVKAAKEAELRRVTLENQGKPIPASQATPGLKLRAGVKNLLPSDDVIHSKMAGFGEFLNDFLTGGSSSGYDAQHKATVNDVNAWLAAHAKP